MPNLGEILGGLVPRIPDGGLVYTLSIAGGVGGTITLAAYGYWLTEKGWSTPRWMRVMHIDNAMAYVISGIFVVAMLIVGAELLYSSGIAIDEGDRGLLDLSDVLADRYGTAFSWIFLIGFWASSFSSVLGVWNGVSVMFADFWGHVRGKAEDHPDRRIGGKYYRFYVLWLTVPPMLLLLMGKPVQVIIAYGVLRLLLHAVPGGHAAGADELPAHAARVAQRARGQHRALRGDAAVRRARNQSASSTRCPAELGSRGSASGRALMGDMCPGAHPPGWCTGADPWHTRSLYVHGPALYPPVHVTPRTVSAGMTPQAAAELTRTSLKESPPTWLSRSV